MDDDAMREWLIRIIKLIEIVVPMTKADPTLRRSYRHVQGGANDRVITIMMKKAHVTGVTAAGRANGLLKRYGLTPNAVTRDMTDRFEMTYAELHRLSESQIIELFRAIAEART